MTLQRVGVSFGSELLDEFDALIKSKGYDNRSEAIRDLVRKSVMDSKIELGSGEVIGTLTIMYDHEAGDVTHSLLHLQHHHHTEIAYSAHLHLDATSCLEVLVVHGDVKNVRKLADNIKAVKGVKHGELVITTKTI